MVINLLWQENSVFIVATICIQYILQKINCFKELIKINQVINVLWVIIEV